jgi:polyisoprenyl-phosphate glycosyltransferase
MAKTIAIVTPVLDDWISFAALVGEISERFSGADLTFYVCAVDDGSAEPFDAESIDLPRGSCVGSIDIIRLAANLGHQRAIAIGLCAVAEGGEADTVLVMDSDGQDRPADIAALLAASRQKPRHVVFAGRAKRSESRAFRVWYGLYRLLFFALTGQRINFGNYCAMPMPAVRRLAHMPELWNNLAASVMRSRLPYICVPTVRGRRSAGRSQMSLVALIAHGLSAMSVYADKIFIRVLLAAGLIAGIAGFGIAVVAAIRIATDLAVPGWATTMTADLLIILLQTLVIVIAASLTVLAGRSSRPIVPIVDSRCFIAGRERCRPNPPQSAVAAVRPAA